MAEFLHIIYVKRPSSVCYMHSKLLWIQWIKGKMFFNGDGNQLELSVVRPCLQQHSMQTIIYLECSCLAVTLALTHRR